MQFPNLEAKEGYSSIEARDVLARSMSYFSGKCRRQRLRGFVVQPRESLTPLDRFFNDVET